MKLANYLDVKSKLKGENALLKFAVVVFGTAALISSISAAIAVKSVKTLIIPSRMTTQYSVTDNWMSDEGIKAHARETMDLFLNYTAESAKSRYGDLMKMVLLTSYSEVREQLEEELRSIERLKIVSTYLVQEYLIDPRKKEIRVGGLRSKVSHGRDIINGSEDWIIRYEIIESNFKVLKVFKYDKGGKNNEN